MTRSRFLPRQAPSTSTDLSETRPDVVPEKREASWVRHQREREQQSAQAMALFNQMAEHMGGLLALTRATAVNDVLFSGARIVPATGIDVLEFPVAWSAITLTNVSTSLLTVGQGGTGAAATVGAGVTRVAPGTFRTWNGRGNGILVFGQPGSTYDLTVFQRPREPSAGPCGKTQGGILIPAGTTASQTVALSGAGLGHLAAVLGVSAVAGGETVQVTLNGVTPSGYVYPLLAGVAVAAVGVTAYRVGPAFTPSPNAVANDLVPPQIQVVATIAGAGSITYGVDLVTA
jgi:hypothetical protein